MIYIAQYICLFYCWVYTYILTNIEFLPYLGKFSKIYLLVVSVFLVCYGVCNGSHISYIHTYSVNSICTP